MATFPHGGASAIWRDIESGAPHNPSKSQVRAWGAAVEGALESSNLTDLSGLTLADDNILAGSDGSLVQLTPSDARSAMEISGAGRLIQQIDITTSTPSLLLDIPSEFKLIEFDFEESEPTTDGAFLTLQLGTGGAGGSFLDTSTYLNKLARWIGTAAAVPARNLLDAFSISTPNTNTLAAYRGNGTVRLRGLNEVGKTPTGWAILGGVDALTVNDMQDDYTYRQNTPGNYNAIRIESSSGDIARLKGKVLGFE